MVALCSSTSRVSIPLKGIMAEIFLRPPTKAGWFMSTRTKSSHLLPPDFVCITVSPCHHKEGCIAQTTRATGVGPRRCTMCPRVVFMVTRRVWCGTKKSWWLMFRVLMCDNLTSEVSICLKVARTSQCITPSYLNLNCSLSRRYFNHCTCCKIWLNI